MSDREEFEYWADEFDHNSDMWEDMGRDEIFMAGMRAARAQGGEAVAEIQGYGADSMRATVRHLVDLTQFPHGTKLYVIPSNSEKE